MLAQGTDLLQRDRRVTNGALVASLLGVDPLPIGVYPVAAENTGWPMVFPDRPLSSKEPPPAVRVQPSPHSGDSTRAPGSMTKPSRRVNMPHLQTLEAASVTLEADELPPTRIRGSANPGPRTGVARSAR